MALLQTGVDVLDRAARLAPLSVGIENVEVVGWGQTFP